MWTIRTANPTDLDVVCANNAAMSIETENKTLDPERLRAGCRAVVSEPAHGQYWLAESAEGTVVGQLMITYEWSDWRNGTFWWIQSVYVHPDYRKRGVFRALYEFVKRQALAAENVCGIRLYVYRNNQGAKSTYEALGMDAYGYEIYETVL